VPADNIRPEPSSSSTNNCYAKFTVREVALEHNEYIFQS
jgi:hypothetical protein